jgi:hypothetical protein
MFPPLTAKKGISPRSLQTALLLLGEIKTAVTT